MDLIDRQALLDELRWVKSQAKASHQEVISDIIKRVEQQHHKPCKVSFEIREPKNFTRSEIRRMAIQNEVFPVKRGEWEYFVETSFNGEITEIDDCGWRCSYCKTPLADVVRGYWDDDSEKPTINFCPNCGAEIQKGR